MVFLMAGCDDRSPPPESPPDNTRPAWDGAEPPSPRAYVAYRAETPPSIDGRLDDSAWSDAPWTERFVDIEGSAETVSPPRWDTRVKMLWDAEYFYIGADLAEPHVWGTLTQRDTVIYLDNDFELFIDPDGDTHRYFELEINALGTVWDLFLVRPYRDGGPAENGWNIEGLRSAVWVDGTLNQHEDIDHGWSVELAIPWAAFGDSGRTPVPPGDGDQWRVNFARVQWDTEVVEGTYRKKTADDGSPLQPHNWVWSPQYAVNLHLPEMWGVVQFSARGPRDGEISVKPPMDAAVHWLLRRIYYEQRAYYRQHQRYAPTVEDLDFEADPVMGPSLSLTLTEDGYELTSTVGGTVWHIGHDGRFWKE